MSSAAESAADVFQAHRDELGFVNRSQCREGDLLTIDIEGRTIGALLGNHCVRKPQSTVYELAVLPEYRREGIGTELIERFAGESPHEKLVAKCPVPLPANDFYASTGWKRVDRESGKKRDLNVWEYLITESPDRITTGRPDLTEIATKYGWLQGSRVDFVDPGPDNCDPDELVAAARRHNPRYVIAGDYDEDNYGEINELSERLRPHAHRVIVVPHKPGEIDRVPDWCVVGYSTPSDYAGTTAPIWEYRDRDVHVLGGTIEQSIEIQGYLGDDVISFDCNSFHRSATQFAKWWAGSSPHWNKLADTSGQADNAVRAYENTMANLNFSLRERGIVYSLQPDTNRGDTDE